MLQVLQARSHLFVNFPFRKKCVFTECGRIRMTDKCGEGAAPAADMIAMIGAGAIQTPREQPMAANVDKFPRSGRKPLRVAFIRPLGANVVHGVVNGIWASGAAEFPCPGRNRPKRRPSDLQALDPVGRRWF